MDPQQLACVFALFSVRLCVCHKSSKALNLDEKRYLGWHRNDFLCSSKNLAEKKYHHQEKYLPRTSLEALSERDYSSLEEDNDASLWAP